MTCPHCQQTAGYHGDRQRTLVGLRGTVPCPRAYYCRGCGHGFAPFDEQAGLTARALTAAVERLATLADAVCQSFERAAELLDEMAGGGLCEATLQRTTEDAGRRLAWLLACGMVLGSAKRRVCDRSVAIPLPFRCHSVAVAVPLLVCA